MKEGSLLEDREHSFIDIEPELLIAAERIMDSLGLSISAAIRVYLKRIVAVGGLPFTLCIDNYPGFDKWNEQKTRSATEIPSKETKPIVDEVELSECSDNIKEDELDEDSEAPEPLDIDLLIKKDNQKITLSMEDYLKWLKVVPRGYIVRRKDVLAFLQKHYDVELVEVEYDSRHFSPYGEGYPSWREVSSRGVLQGGSLAGSDYSYTKEGQQKMLENDGLTILPYGPDGRSLKVKHFRKYLFDFAALDSQALKANGVTVPSTQ